MSDGHGTLNLLEALAELPDRHDRAARDVAGICALMRGDPIHDRDRRRIVQAVVDDADRHAGDVDPNRVRASLTRTNADGSTELVVYPRLIGAVYQGLTAAGVLQRTGWTTSTDVRGGNAGRPARTYRLTRTPENTP